MNICKQTTNFFHESAFFGVLFSSKIGGAAYTRVQLIQESFGNRNVQKLSLKGPKKCSITFFALVSADSLLQDRNSPYHLLTLVVRMWWYIKDCYDLTSFLLINLSA